MKKHRVLVTGASGFLGSTLVDILLYGGHDVIGVIRGYKYPVNEFAQLAVLDLKDAAAFEKVADRFEPTAIVHLAGRASTVESFVNPVACFADNFQSGLTVLEYARGKDLRVILASSNVVYGSNNPYRAAKLALELASSSYKSSYDLSTLCLRFANLYGESQRSRGYAGNFIAAALEAKRAGQPLKIYGDGSARRDWLHVGDAARACLLALQTDATGVLDICSGHEISVSQIVEWVGVATDRQPWRVGDAFNLPQTADAARYSLNFKAVTELRSWLCER